MKISKKIRVGYELAEELARKYIGILMLCSGCFVLGLAAKNFDDAQTRVILQNQLEAQRVEMSTTCDKRIIEDDKQQANRMAERDSLLADQVARITDQATQLKNQGDLIAIIAGRQVENTERNRKAMAALQSTLKQTKEAAASASRTASDARAAAEIAAQESEAQDRKMINHAVTAPAKDGTAVKETTKEKTR